MNTAILIASKDVRQRLRDRSALLIALVVPLALASIFGLIFHNVTTGRVSCDCKFGLVDQDRGAATQAFERQVLRPLERRGLISVRHLPNLGAGRRATDRGTVGATFVFEPGFTRSLAGERPAKVVVLGNTDAPITVQVAGSIARSYASRIDTIRISRAVLGQHSQGAARAASAADPISLSDIAATSNQLSAGTFYAAGMAVFFLFFTVQFGISSIVDERRDGTLARMLVAPVHRSAVLGGKLLTSLVLGVLSMSVLALATHFLLGAHWGNPLGVAILIVTGVVAATAVMALVATVARTVDQAQAWGSMVALVLGMLGGTFFPVSQAGGLLALLSLATPQAWFLRGIQNLGNGAGAGAALGPALAILGFATVTGTLAFLNSRKLAVS
jgi:ABC-2 type transport system permease protein